MHNRHSDSRVGASFEMKTDRLDAPRDGRPAGEEKDRGRGGGTRVVLVVVVVVVVIVVVVVATGPKTTIWRLASL